MELQLFDGYDSFIGGIASLGFIVVVRPAASGIEVASSRPLASWPAQPAPLAHPKIIAKALVARKLVALLGQELLRPLAYPNITAKTLGGPRAMHSSFQ